MAPDFGMTNRYFVTYEKHLKPKRILAKLAI